MAWLKMTDPNRPVGLICRKGLGQAFLQLGLIDYFWEVDKGNRNSYQVIVEALKKFEINYWLSPHTSVRTALFTWQIKAQKKICFKKLWNTLFFHQTFAFPKEWPEALRLLHLLKNENTKLSQHLNSLSQPEQFIQKDNQSALRPAPAWADPHQFLNQNLMQKKFEEYKIADRFPIQNAVVLFPGSVWATKMWKKEKFVVLGNEIVKNGHQVIIMGGASEAELGENIASQIPGAINLCGKSNVLESLLILSKQKLVIGNDSSSSHMASLMGTPVVSAFGPTVLRFGYRPWGKSAKVFEVADLDCRPCGAHGPKVCPLGHHNCMSKLHIDYQDLGI